eukprot:scaffold188387_cov16-Tisochrysis_lutea.AAC.2
MPCENAQPTTKGSILGHMQVGLSVTAPVNSASCLRGRTQQAFSLKKTVLLACNTDKCMPSPQDAFPPYQDGRDPGIWLLEAGVGGGVPVDQAHAQGDLNTETHLHVLGCRIQEHLALVLKRALIVFRSICLKLGHVHR